MSEQNSNPATASQRHWLYGGNMALLALVAIVILGLVCYLTSQIKWHSDWTSGQVHSLAPRTKALLAEVDQKGTDFELASTFSHAADSDDKDQGLHIQDVQDLIAEYTRSSSHVKRFEAETQDEVISKIKQRYKGESKDYEAALADAGKVLGDVSKFFAGEAPKFDELSKSKDLSEDMQGEMASAAGQFEKVYPEMFKQLQKKIENYLDATLPQYSKATDTAKSVLEGVSAQIDSVTEMSKSPGLPKPIAEYYQDAAPRYKAIGDEVKAFRDRLDKLAPMKMDDVVSSLRPDSLLVFTPSEVKVLGFADLYRSDRGPQGEDSGPAKFVGEQAVSSVILSTMHPEKLKVVFVNASTGGRFTSTGLFTDLTSLLKDENCEVMDWAPPSPQGPPDASKLEPPAQGKGVVWLIFPPDAPDQQQMMMGAPPPNPGPVIDAAKKHLDAGGSAVFFAEASASPMMGMMMGGGDFPYDALVKPFGVDVRAPYMVVASMPSGNGERATMPQVEMSRYPDHEITQDLQSLGAVFVGFPNQGSVLGGPTYVGVDSSKPANIVAQVIAQTPGNDDFWASKAFTGPATKYDPKNDLPAPIPMAVAASKDAGVKDKEQRIVVIGSKLMCIDNVLEAGQPVQSGDRIMMLPRFPANGQFVLNSVLWASGYQGHVMLGPRAGVAQRIADMSDAKRAAINWGVIYLGAPILTLIIGGVMFAVRRR